MTSHTAPSTVDPNEVSHFTHLNSIWWNVDGEVRLLHYMNKLRVPLVRDGLLNTGAIKKEFIGTPKPLQGIKILEVGCGGGILTEALAKLGCTITGIDVTPDMIKVATRHAKLDSSLTNVNYCLESVEEHCVKNCEKYDAVVASEVLEHVVNKDVLLEACVKCLKPGGSIFITTFNKTTAAWLLGIIFAEKIANIIPRGTHEWDKFISPKDTEKILQENKCQTKSVRGMSYNLFTSSWYWLSNTSVNYALHAVKL